MLRFRAFTLIEVMVTLAIVGVAAGLGIFAMSTMLAQAQERDSAFRFVEDARHVRADNIRQGLYTVMTTVKQSNGTRVTYGGQRYGTTSATPCEAFLAASVPPDVVVTKFYRELDVSMAQQGFGGGTVTNICFTPGGQPYSNDLSTLMAVQININDGMGAPPPVPDHQLVVDQNGAMESTFDQQTKDGIASNSLYPYNDLGAVTPRPVNFCGPNTLCAPQPVGPTYEDPAGNVIDPNASCGGAAAGAAAAGCGGAAAGPASAGCGGAVAGCGGAAAGCGAAACGAAACGAASCGGAAVAACGGAAAASCGGAAAAAACGGAAAAAACGGAAAAAACGGAAAAAACGGAAAACGGAAAACGGAAAACGGAAAACGGAAAACGGAAAACGGAAAACGGAAAACGAACGGAVACGGAAAGPAAAASCGASCGGSCGSCGGGCGCGGCGGCFVAGTLIATAMGKRPIEDVKIGDDVVAYDASAGDRGMFPVAAVFTRTVDELVILEVGGEAIETTNEHPFWVDGVGFTKAGDLALGDMLVGLSGERRAVDRIDRLRGTFTVHNFHVEGAHTYFVTDMSLLVHNMSALPF